MSESRKEEIADELRSVVQSTKEGVRLRSLQGDFRSLTGYFIPYQEFGYSSLEEMLRNLPKVVRLERRHDGEVYVHAVANEATKHLSALISKQRSNKPRPISKPRRPMGHQPWKPPTPRHNSRNYQRPQRNYNAYPSQQPLPPRVPFPNQNFTQNYPPRRPPLLRINTAIASGHFVSEGVQAGPPPARNNYQVPPRFQKQPPPPIRVPRDSPLLDGLPVIPPSLQPAVISPTFSADAPEFVPQPPTPVTVYAPPLITPAPGSCSTPPPFEPGLPFPKPVSNKHLIDNYAFVNGLNCVYKASEAPSKKKRTKKKWLSQLNIGDQKFLSYPEEMDTPEEAHEEAAKAAVKKLNIHPDSIVSLPIVPSRSPAEKEMMINQVIQILSDSPQGAVHYHVQDLFKRIHKMRLPPNWLDIIQTEESFRIDRADDTHFILFYEKSPRVTPDLLRQVEVNGTAGLRSPTESSGSGEYPFPLPDPCPLPENKYWNIHITYVESTANICFHVIDNIDAFEEFTLEMETFYSIQANQVPVRDHVCGAPYCASYENGWHRVIVQDTNDNNQVLCDFPDVGDSVWLDGNTVFELDRKFLKLPFQAYRGELAGLACFALDGTVSDTLLQRILGKAIVAEPTDREDDNNPFVLYDTSTEDDININQTLFDEILKDIDIPQLSKVGKVHEGFLGDVTPYGDVYVSISDRSMQLLNMLIENVTEIFQAQKTELPLSQVLPSEVHCVLYRKSWYRAMAVSSELLDSNKVSMFLVDCGIQRNIPLSDICKLGEETQMLSQIPTLAVRCRLNGIAEDKNPQRNLRLKEKIALLVPESTCVLIKVASTSPNSQVPVVEVFKRLESRHNELVSVNISIAFESDMVEPVKPPTERKLSRPNSLQTSTPPPISPLLTNGPSSPSTVLSPSASYSFVENTSVLDDRLSGYPVEMDPHHNVNRDVCLNSHSGYGIPSPTVIPSGSSLVVTCPLGSNKPGSPGALLHSENIYSFTQLRNSLSSVTPPIIESSKEMGVNRQEDIPAIQDYFDVYVASAANPNNFICQSKKAFTATQELFDEMQRFYNMEENICEMHQCLIRPGEFFTLKHKDGNWYRAIVQDIVLEDPFTVLVFLVDYGGFEMAKLQDLQVLYTQFRKLPYQAISASLSDVEPVCGDYSPSHCVEFQEMVEEKLFVSIIRAKKPWVQNRLEGTHLSLTLVDTSTPVDVFIHEELVKRKIAKVN